MYTNLESKDVPLQSPQGGVVGKRPPGRPERPNMRFWSGQLDGRVYAKLAQRAKALGASKSFVVGQALRSYLAQENPPLISQ